MEMIYSVSIPGNPPVGIGTCRWTMGPSPPAKIIALLDGREMPQKFDNALESWLEALVIFRPVRGQ